MLRPYEFMANVMRDWANWALETARVRGSIFTEEVLKISTFSGIRWVSRVHSSTVR